MTSHINVVVIRHGEKQGDSLTEKGREQIRAAIALVREAVSSVAKIVHSATGRTKETAEIIAQEYPDAEVKEDRRVGVTWMSEDQLAHLTEVVVAAKQAGLNSLTQWDEALGELGVEMQRRFYSAVNQHTPCGGTIIVVTHEIAGDTMVAPSKRSTSSPLTEAEFRFHRMSWEELGLIGEPGDIDGVDGESLNVPIREPVTPYIPHSYDGLDTGLIG